jgi:hypothetical protein
VSIPPPSVLISADNEYRLQPDEETLTRGGVEISSVSLIERVDLNPIRVEVNFLGSLPTTCNQLRLEVGLPDDQYQINITAYSIVKPSPNASRCFSSLKPVFYWAFIRPADILYSLMEAWLEILLSISRNKI